MRRLRKVLNVILSSLILLTSVNITPVFADDDSHTIQFIAETENTYFNLNGEPHTRYNQSLKVGETMGSLGWENNFVGGTITGITVKNSLRENVLTDATVAQVNALDLGQYPESFTVHVKSTPVSGGGFTDIYGQDNGNCTTPDGIDDRTQSVVKFVNWDGTVLKMQVISRGGSATPPPAPTRQNYTFSGWDMDYENVTDGFLTVTALYTRDLYSISYYLRPGDLGTLSLYNVTSYGTEALGSENVAKVTFGGESEGWVLVGYFTEGHQLTAGQIASLTPNKDLNFEIRTMPDMVGQDNMACDTPDGIDDRLQAMVTFVDFDSTVLSKKVVTKGETVSAPSAPVRPGYSFTGWSEDLTNIQEDLIIFAQYEENAPGLPTEYSVNYEVVNGSGADSLSFATYMLYVGDKISNAGIPSVELLPGWVVKGYLIDGDSYTKNQLANYTPDSDVTVQVDVMPDMIGQDNANCETPDGIDDRLQAKIIFVDYDSTVLSKKVVAKGESVTAPNAPTRPGHTFTGWSESLTNIQGDMIIYAVYEQGGAGVREEYSISYEVTNGTGFETLSFGTYMLYEGDKITDDGIPSVTLSEGWMIKEYLINSQTYTKEQLADFAPASDITVYINVVENKGPGQETEYSIEYEVVNGNGLEALSFNTYALQAESKLTEEGIPTVTLSSGWVIKGYLINGECYTKEQLKELTFAADTKIQIDVMPDMVGQDDLDCNTPDGVDDRLQASVTFLDYDGSFLKRNVVYIGETVVAPADPYRYGYEFTGWDKALENITQDTTITATYRPVEIVPSIYNIKLVRDGLIVWEENLPEGTVIVINNKNGVEVNRHVVSQDFSYDVEAEIVPNMTFESLKVDVVDGIYYFSPVYSARKLLVSYQVNTDSVGHSLSFYECEVEYGAALGASCIPTVTLDSGWYVKEYVVDGVKYSRETLANYFVQSSKFITIEIMPDMVGQDDDNCTTPDGIDDRLQATVTFMANGNVVSKEVVLIGNGATAPEAPVLEGYEFVGWEGNYETINGNTIIVATYQQKEAAKETYFVSASFEGLEIFADNMLENSTLYIVKPDDTVVAEYLITENLNINVLYETERHEYIEYWIADFNGDNVYLKPVVGTHPTHKITFTLSPADEGLTSLTNEYVYILQIEDLKFEDIPLVTGDGWAINYFTIGGEAFTSAELIDYNFVTDTEVVVHAKLDLMGQDDANCTTPDGIDDRNQALVTFKDWNENVLSNQVILKGNNATAPEDPTRDGYIFTGWNKELEGITENTIITAQYIKESDLTKTVIIKVDGEIKWQNDIAINTVLIFVDKDDAEIHRITVTEDVEYEAEIPSVIGMDFVELIVTNEGNMYVFKPKYDWKMLDVTYSVQKDDEGSSLSFESTKVMFNNSIGSAVPAVTLPTGWVVDYYKVDGRAINEEELGNLVVQEAKHIEIYVMPDMVGQDNNNCTTPDEIDDRLQIIVTFEDWNGGLIEKKVAYKGDVVIAPVAPNREGYTFQKWSDEYSEVSQDVTVRAEYEKNKYETKISYNGNVILNEELPYNTTLTIKTLNNDFELETLVEELVENAKEYEIPALTIPGLATLTWKVEKVNFTRSQGNDPAIVIYPEFTLNKYTVNYQLREGDSGSLSFNKAEDLITNETPLGISNVPTVTLPEGWYLLGYELDGNLYSANDLADAVITENATVIVKTYPDIMGQDNNDCSTPDGTDDRTQALVEFKDGLTNETISKQVVTKGEDATAPTPIEKEGLVFNGWLGNYQNVQKNEIVESVYATAKYEVTVYLDGAQILDTEVNHGTILEVYTIKGNDSVESLAQKAAITSDLRVDLEKITSSAVIVRGWKLVEMIVDNVSIIKYIPVFDVNEYNVYFTVRQGDAGSLDFSSLSGVVGATIGNNLPTISFSEEEQGEGWTLVGMFVGGVQVTADELAALKPSGDLRVEFRTMPDTVGQDNAGCTTPDGIDDRTQATVKFYAMVNGAEELIKTEVVLKGEGATAPVIDTVDGYTFSGWDVEFNNVINDIEVHAKYEEQIVLTYTIRPGDAGALAKTTFRFDKGEAIGTNVAAVSLTEEEILNAWVVDGYYLDGIRYTVEELALITLTESKEIEVRTYPDAIGQGSNNEVNVSDGIDDRTQAIVRFEDHDGTLIKAEVVKVGSSATAPANPIRPHYTFKEWDGNYQNIERNETVVAKYDGILHTVKYVLRDGDNGTLSFVTVEIQEGEKLGTENIPTLTFSAEDLSKMWKLDGFYVDGSKIETAALSEIEVDKDMIIEVRSFPDRIGQDNFACITPDGIDDRLQAVVWFTDHDDRVLELVTVMKGEDVVATVTPTREHHAFIGWDTDTTNVQETLTVKAMYEVNNYSLTVDYNGEEVSSGSYPYETEIVVNTVDLNTLESKIYKTLTLSGDSEIEVPLINSPAIKVTGWKTEIKEGTVVISMEYEKIQYKLNYVLRDGDLGQISKTMYTLTGGNKVGDNIPTVMFTEGELEAGWKLVGYYLNNTMISVDALKEIEMLSDVAIEIKTMPDHIGQGQGNNVNVADGVDDRTQVIVNFVDYNDALLKAEVVLKGGNATAPENPIRDGYTFKAWNSEFTNVQNNLTVKAVYFDKITIEFVMRDGDDGVINNSEIVIDVDSKLGSNMPTVTFEEGWSLIGYYIDDTKVEESDLANMIFGDDAVVEIRAMKDLLGNGNNGETNIPDGIDDRTQALVKFVDYNDALIKSEVVTKGEPATAPATPTREGYTFKKWDTEFTVITEDTTVKAIYLDKIKVAFVMRDGDLGSISKSEFIIDEGTGLNELPTISFSEEANDWKFVGYYIAGAKVEAEELKSKVFNTDTVIEVRTMKDILGNGSNGETNVPDGIDDREQVIAKFIGFDGNLIEEKVVVKGSTVTAPALPAVEGYTAKGWDKSLVGVYFDTVFTAVYEENKPAIVPPVTDNDQPTQAPTQTPSVVEKPDGGVAGTPVLPLGASISLILAGIAILLGKKRIGKAK